MYNVNMSLEPDRQPVIDEPEKSIIKPLTKKSGRGAIVIAIAGVVLTIAMFIMIIAFNEQVKMMQNWGYVGAFLISLLGGATIIIPVPMLAVVVALASALATPWEVALLGFSAAGGEVIGALIIYFTGKGAGSAIDTTKTDRLHRIYDKMVSFIQRRGSWALFSVTFIINPLFYPAAFVCGALKFGLRRFIIVVALGKLVKCMTVVYVSFYGLKSILRAIGIEI
jgi:membrane protein YqaA with SNARE-associated domain